MSSSLPTIDMSVTFSVKLLKCLATATAPPRYCSEYSSPDEYPVSLLISPCTMQYVYLSMITSPTTSTLSFSAFSTYFLISSMEYFVINPSMYRITSSGSPESAVLISFVELNTSPMVYATFPPCSTTSSRSAVIFPVISSLSFAYSSPFIYRSGSTLSTMSSTVYPSESIT